MIPQTKPRKNVNSSKVNLIISLTFHGLIIGALLYFAAREGLLGKQVKKIMVEMEKKEKTPEKPKEPEKPKLEQPKIEAPKLAKELPRETPPPPRSADAAPPTVAPAATDVPAFEVAGGRTVETSSDPVELYRGLIQNSLQSRWNRPENMEDRDFTVEVEVGVDSQGDITDAVWKKGSGNKRWDDSVRQALTATKSVDRPPPKNFPSRVIVRFDVAEAEAVLQ